MNPLPQLPRAGRSRAFTLIEVVLAIAIFGGVLAAIYGVWAGVVRGSRAALDAAADVQRGRMTQRCLEDALSTAVIFTGNQRFYSFIGEPDGEFAYLSFVARLPDSFPGAGMFGDLTVRRVTFQMRPGTNSSYELLMTQVPYLFATNSEQEAYSLVVAKNVRLFQVQYLDTNAAGALRAGTGQGDWVDTWPYSNRFPAKVQFALGLDSAGKQSGSVPYVVSGIVSMPASAVANTMPGGNSPAGGNTPGPTPPGTLNPGVIRPRR